MTKYHMDYLTHGFLCVVAKEGIASSARSIPENLAVPLGAECQQKYNSIHKSLNCFVKRQIPNNISP